MLSAAGPRSATQAGGGLVRRLGPAPRDRGALPGCHVHLWGGGDMRMIGPASNSLTLALFALGVSAPLIGVAVLPI